MKLLTSTTNLDLTLLTSTTNLDLKLLTSNTNLDLKVLTSNTNLGLKVLTSTINFRLDTTYQYLIGIDKRAGKHLLPHTLRCENTHNQTQHKFYIVTQANCVRT